MNSSPLHEQVQLFKSVFKGRADVFAIRWEKGNKSGYMPAHTFDSYFYLDFDIENLTIRPEFEVLKPYFAKALKSKM